MSRIADYTIINSGSFAFGAPLVTHTFQINLPDGFHGGSRCILSFNIGGIKGDDDTLKLRVHINGTLVYSYKSSADIHGFSTVQQVVSGGLFNVSGQNEIVFSRASGFGHAILSDVVMLSQVDTSLMRSVQIDDGGNIFAGGNGVDGDVVLRSNRGSDRIRLDANGANVWMGGNGADGDLVLFRSDGDNKTLAGATVHINGDSGDVRLGANGVNGDLALFPSHVSGITSALSKASIRLDGFNARLTVGGGGGAEVGNSRDGEVYVRGGADKYSRIQLRGSSAEVRAGGGGADGRMLLRSATHENRIRLDAQPARILVGGGSVGQATIHLDGETGEITAKGEVAAASFVAAGTLLDVPDYVLEADYALMSPEELGDFVTREKRLPRLPGAAQVQREGVDLGRFQMQLLEKIEELTLYMLDQHRTIKSLQDRIDALEANPRT